MLSRIALGVAIASMVAALLVFQVATAGGDRSQSSSQVSEMSKADFVEHLKGEQSVVIGFYEQDHHESASMLDELEALAALAKLKHPELNVRKVNHAKSPYLTARMLLTSMPELHFIAKDVNGKWSARSLDPTQSATEIADYVSKRLLERKRAAAPALCTPFNICGRALGFFAEKSSALDNALPIPKWLAMILIPALITLVGRFVIDGMYSAETWVRDSLAGTGTGTGTAGSGGRVESSAADLAGADPRPAARVKKTQYMIHDDRLDPKFHAPQAYTTTPENTPEHSKAQPRPSRQRRQHRQLLPRSSAAN
ncbi:hypothetical protein GGI07_003206 [Coemansia sp. Benny D115]|nr:hypothetical protein GGI07_003206 [Coemansia sp. Benny D115]